MRLPIRVHRRDAVKGNVPKKLAGTSVPEGSSVFEKEGKKRRPKIRLTRAMRDDLARVRLCASVCFRGDR